MKQTIISQLTEGDVPKIIEKFQFPWARPEETTRKWHRYLHEQNSQQRIVLVAREDEKIVGYGSLLFNSPYQHFKENNIPELSDIWIDTHHRKQGYGTLLIKHLEEKAIQSGYTKTGLGVGLYADYGPAQKLYFSLGYQPDGNGITYHDEAVQVGHSYAIDDDLVLWLIKHHNKPNPK